MFKPGLFACLIRVNTVGFPESDGGGRGSQPVVVF
jgi:hypothetical protein